MTKILIAEDDKFLANAYRVKFEKEQFEVVIVFDGEEAISVLKKDKPDIILLDLMMPKQDGFTTLSLLKSNKDWAKIPVVVTSNLSQESDFQKAKELGAVDYLVKSDTPISDIVAKVRSYI